MISLHHTVLNHQTYNNRKYLCSSLEYIKEKNFPDSIEIEGKNHRVIFYKNNGISGRFIGVYYPNPEVMKTIPALDEYALFVFIDEATRRSWLQSKEK